MLLQSPKGSIIAASLVGWNQEMLDVQVPVVGVPSLLGFRFLVELGARQS
jgi:hypothetical protein